jgi:putative ABC transport system ATP-binding protein
MSKLIEFNKVNKTYKSADQTVWALKEVSFSLSSGDYLAVVGPSGAGKSTLLHVLGGLDAPSSGSVFFKGANIYSMKDKGLSLWRAAHIGFVFQFYHLIEELNALENIELAYKVLRRKYPLKDMDELIQYLGIGQRKRSYPSQLSGGERQKVALARALANDPEIILCDEPTGNLDQESYQKVVDLLESCNSDKGKTIVLVTHNLELAKRAKKIVFMENGVFKS